MAFSEFYLVCGTLDSGITFPRPTAFGPGAWPSGSGLRPYLLFYGLRPKWLFHEPLTMELLFHGPPSIKNYLFTAPVTTKVCHVFLYFFKQNSTYSLFENPFQKKVLSYINQSIIEWIDWLVFYSSNWKLFLNRLEKYKRKNFGRSNVKQNIYV